MLLRLFPRALPWALLFRPFRPRRRLKGGNIAAQGNALGNRHLYRPSPVRAQEVAGLLRETDLTSLEIDEHLAEAGSGMSDSTRHHNVVALQRLQQVRLCLD